MANGGNIGVLPPEFFGVSGIAGSLRTLRKDLDDKDQREKDEARQKEQDDRAEDQRGVENRRADVVAAREQTLLDQVTQRFEEQTLTNTATQTAFEDLGYKGPEDVQAQIDAGTLTEMDLRAQLIAAQTTTEGMQPDLVLARMEEMKGIASFRDQQLSESIRQFDASLESDERQFKDQMALRGREMGQAESQFQRSLNERRLAAQAASAASNPLLKAQIAEAVEIAQRSGIGVEMVFQGIQNPGVIPLLDEAIQQGRNAIAEQANLEVEKIREDIDMERARALIAIISTEGLEGSEAAARTAEVLLQQMFEDVKPGLATFGVAEEGALWWKKDVTALSVNTELLAVADGQAIQLLIDEVIESQGDLETGLVERAQTRLTAALETNTPEVIVAGLDALLADNDASDAEKQLAESMKVLLELQEGESVKDDSEIREQIISENGDDAFESLTDTELRTRFSEKISERDRVARSGASGGPLSASFSRRQEVNKIAAEARAIQTELLRRRGNR